MGLKRINISMYALIVNIDKTGPIVVGNGGYALFQRHPEKLI